MSAGEYCTRDVVIVERTESLRTAINLMRSEHVGDVVVVDKENSSTKPIGILTDRDIVVEILAEDVELDEVAIGDVMSFQLITVNEDTKLMDAIKRMRSEGVRRLPVVDNDGGLVGILSADDVLELIAEQMSDLVALVAREIGKEKMSRL